MVEKVSDGIAKSIAEVDVSSDKNDFLDLINKKKKDKKPAEMHDAVAVVLGNIPQMLNKSVALGGGTKLTNAQNAAKSMLEMGALLPEASSDKALRNKILALAGLPGAEKKPTRESTDNVSVNDATAKGQDKALTATLAATAAQANSATAAHANIAAARQASAQVAHETLAASSASSRSSAARHNEAESGSQNSLADASLVQRGQASVMQFSESAFTGAPRNETAARGEKAQVQTAATQVVNGESVEKQSVDLNYQFQRWSGDHSVKVSIPTDARGNSNITMQPSDTRAADALSRHMAQMPAQRAELLQPKTQDGNIALAMTDSRSIDGSARLTTQSAEPASELYHAQHDSEERERQRQHDSAEEEQE